MAEDKPLGDKVDEIIERLVRIETRFEGLEDHEARLRDLEHTKSILIGVIFIVGALWAVVVEWVKARLISRG